MRMCHRFPDLLSLSVRHPNDMRGRTAVHLIPHSQQSQMSDDVQGLPTSDNAFQAFITDFLPIQPLRVITH